MLPGARGVRGTTRVKKQNYEDSVMTSRLERWHFTGVIALSECGLTVHKSYLEHEIRAILSFCCFCYFLQVR